MSLWNVEEIDMGSLDWGILRGHEGILKAGGQQSLIPA